jgi:phosphatidylglycerol---prolipoprotein diacylglyceryl transferase
VLYNAHARLPHRLRNGDIILGYLILYPLGRFFIEFFRPDAWTMGALAAAQWFALGMMAVAGLALVLRHIFWKRDGESETALPPSENSEGVAQAE